MEGGRVDFPRVAIQCLHSTHMPTLTDAIHGIQLGMSSLSDHKSHARERGMPLASTDALREGELDR